MRFAGDYGLPVDEIRREAFFNVGGSMGFMRWGVFILMWIALIYLAWTVCRRVKIWRGGRPELRTDFPERRLGMVIRHVLLQGRLFRDRFAGIMHGLMFYSFLGLLVISMLYMADHNLSGLVFNYHFIRGNVYLFLSFLADLMGLFILIGLSLAAYRRYVSRPSCLDTRKGDTILLVFLFLLVFSGFLTEGLRIALSGMPRYEAWAFIGYFFAGIFSGSGFYTLQTLHYGLWWIHMLGALAFIGFAATGKPGHMVVDLLNVYYGNLDNENPAAKYRLRPSAEPEERACSGEGHAVRFTWKSLMDLDACVRCGRCQDICPAWLTEKPLSPKKLITALKAEMEELPAPLPGAHVSSMPGKGIVSGKSVSGEELWACTSCGACMEVCPVMVEHLPVITELRRREILASGNTPAELAAVFGNLERSFNPQGLNPEDRGAWLLSLEGSPMRTLDEDSDADYLYFPGSWVCFDDRARRATEAFLGIMEAAGIKLGILGAEESDSGDAALRGGNEALFRMLAKRNIEAFIKYGVKKIICSSPHDYNILKKEYGAFAASLRDPEGRPLKYEIEVYHHTEIIGDLLKKGRISLTGRLASVITFHDPCFLGRYNEVYDEPRDIISAIPDATLAEMNHYGPESFCCGGGGIGMFTEDRAGRSIEGFRAREAQYTGASIICTACPLCHSRLSDGLAELNIRNMKVLDIAELVFGVMKRD